MSSRSFSIVSSHGLSNKNFFQKCIPFLITLMLGIELLAIITLIVFYDKSDKGDNLLYIATVSYIIISTIYFAWHSVVKENSFELLAFSLMSTILNAVAITLTIRHNVIDEIKWTCVGLFIIAQGIYFYISVYLYKHFHHYMLHDADESIFEKKLVAVRAFEMFVSMIKLDFLLYSIILGTYMYYVAVKWSEFKIWGILIGVGIGIVLVGHTAAGVLAAIQEKVIIIRMYFFGMVLTVLAKVYLLTIVTVQPGKSFTRLLIEQDYIVFVGDLFVKAGIIYLGIWTYKSFGIGAMSVIRKANEDSVRLPFI